MGIGPARAPQTRSKQYGYSVEVAAARELSKIFGRLERVGSVGYASRGGADLVQSIHPGGGQKPLVLVVTRDRHQPLLVTLSVRQLEELLDLRMAGEGALLNHVPVVVQVKGRASSFIGRVWRALREATSG